MTIMENIPKLLFSSVVIVNLVKLPSKLDIMVAVLEIFYCLHFIQE